MFSHEDRYRPETNEELMDRFGVKLPAISAESLTRAYTATSQKFQEAIDTDLIEEVGDLQHAKAAVFSPQDVPELTGWFDFYRDPAAPDIYTVDYEGEAVPKLALTRGGLVSRERMRYQVGRSSDGIGTLQVVGFKPSLRDTDQDRAYAERSLNLGFDSFGIGEEATRYHIDPDEGGLRKLALAALHGIKLGVDEEGEPTLDITDIQKAVRFLSGQLILTESIGTDMLIGNIEHCELVRPDVDHRLGADERT